MLILDANIPVYEKVKVFGKDMIFTECRIRDTMLPSELYRYEVRYCDEGFEEPAEVSEYIWINFFGSLISKEPITEWDVDFNGRHHRYIRFDGKLPKKEDWAYQNFSLVTLEEYLDTKEVSVAA